MNFCEKTREFWLSSTVSPAVAILAKDDWHRDGDLVGCGHNWHPRELSNHIRGRGGVSTGQLPLVWNYSLNVLFAFDYNIWFIITLSVACLTLTSSGNVEKDMVQWYQKNCSANKVLLLNIVLIRKHFYTLSFD